MGCFNFDCANCGEGMQRDEEGYECDGRDYFDKPVRIQVRTKSGKFVFLEGRYTGYGEVEVEFGSTTETFYPKQFAEYWDCWTTEKQFVSEEIYCEDCMEDYPLTSRAEFDLSDFTLAVDYMAVNMPPPGSMAPWRSGGKTLWNTGAPSVAAAAAAPAQPVADAVGGAAPTAAATPKKKVKVAKPKPLTKEELVKKVTEMEAELERLRPLEQRFKTLEAENQRFREDLRTKNENLLKIRKIVIGY